MKEVGNHNRSFFIAVFTMMMVLALAKCVTKKEDTFSDDRVWKGYAGADKCKTCHNSIYESNLKTAHHNTSGTATSKTILGSFHKDSNTYFFNRFVSVVMEQKNDSFYQVVYQDGVEKIRKRIDIVIGSGAKGQSYLSWRGNRLFQLPITYFTPEHQWSNSPGFPGRAVFNRPITSRCLECHVTYAVKINDEEKEGGEEFDQKKIIFTIDCEKCHGPAAAHVEYYKKNPPDTIAKFILNPANFTRQQNLDLCALCHGGRRNKTRASFSFQPGDKLSDYFVQDTIATIAAGMDVHGNQFGLLANSKCFTMSQMTCMSCHNIHENERGKTALFSSRCINCHQPGHEKICSKRRELGKAIQQNCIDCHMPKEPSRSVAVFLQGKDVPTPALMRTHLIKIYPNETKKVIAAIGQLESKKK